MEAMIGEIRYFAFGFAPKCWLPCNGMLLPLAQFTALSALLWTRYGGDGVTTFALPDLRGRTVIGASFVYEVGGVYGAASVRLTEANLPSHGHSLVEVEVAGVPEPATWATMIAGFGLIGGGLRRKARAAAKA